MKNEKQPTKKKKQGRFSIQCKRVGSFLASVGSEDAPYLDISVHSTLKMTLGPRDGPWNERNSTKSSSPLDPSSELLCRETEGSLSWPPSVNPWHLLKHLARRSNRGDARAENLEHPMNI